MSLRRLTNTGDLTGSSHECMFSSTCKKSDKLMFEHLPTLLYWYKVMGICMVAWTADLKRNDASCQFRRTPLYPAKENKSRRRRCLNYGKNNSDQVTSWLRSQACTFVECKVVVGVLSWTVRMPKLPNDFHCNAYRNKSDLVLWAQHYGHSCTSRYRKAKSTQCCPEKNLTSTVLYVHLHFPVWMRMAFYV